jgi:riboflavin kinase / FMN adenylyltransferase
VLEITNPAELPLDFADTAVAIGKFDGIHLGHQQLFHELVELSEDAGLAATVFTFDRHPRTLFDPAGAPKPLIGPIQKAALLEAVGIDLVLTAKFDEELAALTPDEFVARYLVPLRARIVLVGEGFRFGVGGSGSIEDLRRIGAASGFLAKEVKNVMLGDSKISSTRIRALLDSGEVSQAAVLLGRNHETTGVVEHGRKLGRTIGFPTANISRSAEGYLPADGVYAGYLISDGVRYPAAHSVGTNDSVAEVPRLLESHVIGRDDLDLYDKVVTCEYLAKVRGWAKFDSLELLVEQIAKDVAVAASLLEE